ncbi:MAG: hypothetical protein K9L62_00100 [Vallitaleaceae bacterium]|nr:hypothetical protein [Vallitaleaceae bacterium]
MSEKKPLYNKVEVMAVNNSFNIIGGIIYVDKWIYREAQEHDNNISKLLGSQNLNMFKPRPTITTGIHSVTIDYRSIDSISVPKDPKLFVEELRTTYNTKVRGHILIKKHNQDLEDIIINKF